MKQLRSLISIHLLKSAEISDYTRPCKAIQKVFISRMKKKKKTRTVKCTTAERRMIESPSGHILSVICVISLKQRIITGNDILGVYEAYHQHNWVILYDLKHCIFNCDVIKFPFYQVLNLYIMLKSQKLFFPYPFSYTVF